jgi:phosphopentomutase
MRVMLVVLDSVGVGEAPDAAHYGDQGSGTLPHIAEAVGGLHLPFLQSLGLGNIPALLPKGKPLLGVPPVDQPLASYGAMQEMSEGKDTITGHWELAGIHMDPGFHLFPAGPPSFPAELLDAFAQQTGRAVIGNRAASGIRIVDELGHEHMQTGAWIVYTSADSVFQIAAHTGVIPLEELYRACELARTLCDPYRVGRVIARPFRGEPGRFERTDERRDYAFPPPEPLILERVHDAGLPVYAVGKIEDIYAHRGITESDHTGNTQDSQLALRRFTRETREGLIIANFIDFDMLYGHRRDPVGYADALQQSDAFFADYVNMLYADDLLIITADHGNDPTFKGTDHTREYVPLLAYQPGQPGRNLGLRTGFYDVAQTIAAHFGLNPLPRGRSFLP